MINSSCTQVQKTETATATAKGPYTFRLSDKVAVERVSYKNRYGSIAADMYLPRDIDRAEKHAAIAVSGPFVRGNCQTGTGLITCTRFIDGNFTRMIVRNNGWRKFVP
jgi:hypothetical protein